MYTLLKNIFVTTLYYVSKPVSLLLPKPVSALCFHSVDTKSEWPLNVTPETFEMYLMYLKKRGIYFCSANELQEYVAGSRIFSQPTVHITFDDGYASVHKEALPILEKYNIPATVFVMGDFEASVERRGTELPGLSEAAIRELQASPLITLGYHGQTHKMLDTIPVDVVDAEIKPPFATTLFAYPGGHKNKMTLERIASMGYTLAFSISGGLILPDTDPLLVPRSVVLNNDTSRRVFLYTTYAWHWFRKYSNGVKKRV